MDTKKSILGIIVSVFLLLGALFGVNIMSFIFGNLAISSGDIIDDLTTGIQYNATNVYLNSSIGYYTINEVNNTNYSGGFAVTYATNISDPTQPFIIPSSNYTIDADSGTIVNSTACAYDEVNLSYYSNYKSEQELISDEINNDSLNALSTYSSGATTQMNVVNITIVIALLVAIFAFFWAVFIKGKKGSGGSNKVQEGGFM